MVGNDFGFGIGQDLTGGNLGKVGSLCDIGLGRGGDLELVDGGVSSFGGDMEVGGGGVSSFGGDMEVGDGNVGGSTVTGGVFGGFGGVNTEMLGGTNDNVGGPNVSAGDGSVGTGVVGVEVKLGGKGGNLGLGNGGTFLALWRRCRVAKATLVHESGIDMKKAMINR